MTTILAEQSAEKRREGEALIWETDSFACQSWNERRGPIDPSLTIDQAINGGCHGLHSNAPAAKSSAMPISQR